MEGSLGFRGVTVTKSDGAQDHLEGGAQEKVRSATGVNILMLQQNTLAANNHPNTKNENNCLFDEDKHNTFNPAGTIITTDPTITTTPGITTDPTITTTPGITKLSTSKCLLTNLSTW